MLISNERRAAVQARRLARHRFEVARRAEIEFQHQLASVGRHVGKLIRGFAPNGVVTNRIDLEAALHHYSAALRPWAAVVTARMQSQVNQKDIKAWTQLGRTMGVNLRKEIEGAGPASALRDMLAEQVHLITSIPLDAAQRVHKLTVEALLQSSRAAEIQKEILRSGQVAVSRAKTIARTEVARTSSILTQTRAEHVGSEGYLWRTAGDSDVRPVHRKLEGKFIRWDEPPVAGENGERAHAGQIYNCRCYPEVVVPDRL